MKKLSLTLAAAVVSTSLAGPVLAQADGAPEVMPGCDPVGELGPAGVLPEREQVWVRRPDVRGDDLTGSFCTSNDWVQDHEDPADVIEVCTVGEGGLDIGPGPFGHYYERKGEGGEVIPADPRITIMRDPETGKCYIPPALVS